MVKLLRKAKDDIIQKKDEKLKNNMTITINYYDKISDTLIKQSKIKNSTLKDIEEILLEIYPNEQHMVQDEKGIAFLGGGYDITPKMKILLDKKFNIDIDIYNFNCQLEEEYNNE